MGGERAGLDTRNKILNGDVRWPEFPRPIAVATGYFEVLRAAHVRELEAARRAAGAATLLVIVMPREGELLPQRARAEMVAALRIVDYVVCGVSVDALRPDAVFRLEKSDERCLGELRVSAGGPSGSAANK